MEKLEKYNRIKYFLLFIWILLALIPLILCGSFETKEIYLVEHQLTPLGSFVQNIAGLIFFTVYFGSQVLIIILMGKDE